MAEQRTIVNGQFVETLEESDPDLYQAFSDFREKMSEEENSTGWIKVYRIPTDYMGNPIAGTKRRSELFNFPWGTMQPDDVIARVRQEYMRKGEVRITIQITGNRDGAKGLLINRHITIEKPNEPPPKEGDTFTDVMRAMQEMQRASDERMDKLVNVMATRAAPAEPMDPMKMMAMMIGMMTMGMNVSKQNAPAAVMSADPMDQMVKIMGMMTSFKSFTEKLGGDSGDKNSGGGDNLAGILSSVAKISEPIALMLKNSAAAPKQLGFRPGAGPGERVIRKDMRLKENRATAPTSDVAPESPKETPPQDTEQMQLTALKENLGLVITLHDAGNTPDAVARLMLNAAPPDTHDQLLEIVQDENFVANMALLDARVNLDPEWYTNLSLEVAGLIDPDSIEEVTSDESPAV